MPDGEFSIKITSPRNTPISLSTQTARTSTATMCWPIITAHLNCGHSSRVDPKCPGNCKQKKRARRAQRTRQSSWACMYIFWGFQRPENSIWKLKEWSWCPTCADKRAERTEKVRQRDEEQAAKEKLSKERLDQQHAQRTGSQRKIRDEDLPTRMEFICTVCTSARRAVLVSDRDANSGCCCANGIDEFEWMYGNGWTGEPNPSQNSRSNANHPLPDRNKPLPPLPNGRTYSKKEQEKIRQDSKAAGERNGWSNSRTRHSTPLEPELVADVMNIPGTSLNAFLIPQPRSPEDVHEYVRNGPQRQVRVQIPKEVPSHHQAYVDGDPTMINWEQWDQSLQTHHGRYPPPSTPPSGPLPPPPARKRFVPSRTTTPHPTHSTCQRTPFPPLFARLSNSRVSLPRTSRATQGAPTRSRDRGETTKSIKRATAPKQRTKNLGSSSRNARAATPDTLPATPPSRGQELRTVASKLSGRLNEAVSVWERAGRERAGSREPSPLQRYDKRNIGNTKKKGSPIFANYI